ncbi:MAG: M23 family metallopeptidase [Bacteroidota bacterium]
MSLCMRVGLLLMAIVSTCGSLKIHAQYPSYSSPLNGPLLVTGTFGELRSNHFHAGIDFRASTGTPVLAVAEGFVSRIVASAGGYGQAIYIDHPDGYRSVYGHLNTLAPELFDTLRARQYEEETFGITLHFGPEDFPVSEGQTIGQVGNRGRSSGPHLHFEIREASTDRAINPLHFGLRIADSREPDLRQLMVYELDEHSRTINKHQIRLKRTAEGRYRAAENTIIVHQPLLAVGIKAYDRQNGMPNYNGIYSAQLWVDSTRLHAFRFDAVAFEETRYLNAHTDYAEWTKNTSWFHRLFRLPGDSLGIYATSNYHGQFRLPAGKRSQLVIEVDDFAGNRSSVVFEVLHQPKPRPLGANFNYELLHDEGNLIQRSDMEFELPPGALYRDLQLQYSQARDESANIYSPVHHLHRPEVPLHKSANMRILPDANFPDSLRAYAVIARCLPGGKLQSLGGKWAGKWLEARTRQFGSYCIMIDREAPVIENIDFRRSMPKQSSFTFRLSDRFGGMKVDGGFRYRAEIDGQWILMEHDAKSGKITHTFDGRISRGEHLFLLKVWDERGNEAVYESTFVR